MLPFRKIIFAADLSEPCQAAAPYVREMTERGGAELVILHATEIAAVPPDPLRPFLAESLPLYAAIRKEQRERMEAFIGEHFAGLHPELLLVDGDAGPAIEETVRRKAADLVMMSTHGRGTLRRFLLGSVTAKMLHDLSCAVWTGVHWKDGIHQPRVPYRSIVCAVDFHEEDAGVIRTASELAKAYGASLSVTHAVDWPESSVLTGSPVYARGGDHGVDADGARSGPGSRCQRRRRESGGRRSEGRDRVRGRSVGGGARDVSEDGGPVLVEPLRDHPRVALSGAERIAFRNRTRACGAPRNPRDAWRYPGVC